MYFVLCKPFLLLKTRKIISRLYCEQYKMKPTNDSPNDINFFMKLFDTTGKEAAKIISENRKLYTTNHDDLLKSIKMLKILEINTTELKEYPSILMNSALSLQNRHTILKECGFNSILLFTIARYVTIMNKNINILKAHGHIPYDHDVPKNLCQSFTDLEINIRNDVGENISLNDIRKFILNTYLKQKIAIKETDLKKLWKIYPRLRHRSFSSISTTISLLQHDLNFCNEKIIKNGYLLHADPSNIKQILKIVRTIAGHDIREIVTRRPKILMTNWDSILQTLDHIRSNGISDTSISRCLEIFTLGPDTIKERLKELRKIKEFEVLVNHPRILRLVYYQNKALHRLDYLKQLKVKCASLHILSGDSESFERYAREGTDRTKGREVVSVLSKYMQKSIIDLRNSFARHPNWCHVPVLSVKQTFDYMISKDFTPEDIFQNIHLLLYPINRIEEKLILIEKKRNEFIEIDKGNLTKVQLLGLILYYIESDFHFTGDGIWADPNESDVYHFTNPEIPMKEYNISGVQRKRKYKEQTLN